MRDLFLDQVGFFGAFCLAALETGCHGIPALAGGGGVTQENTGGAGKVGEPQTRMARDGTERTATSH